MRRFITDTFVTGIVCGGILASLASRPVAAAGRAANDASNDASNDAIARADRALVQALEKGDRKAANKLLDADFTWIDPDGVMWAKEDALRAGLKPLVGSGDDVKIIAHKYGKVVWIQENQGKNYVAHFWVQRPAGWRLLHTTEIAVRERDFQPIRPTYDIPCANPCKDVPYKPLSAGEKAALDEWQEQESSMEGWEKHVADNLDQRVVSTYGGPSPSKADRIAGMKKRMEANPNAPKVGAAPALWIRTWDFGDAVVMIACQPTYGEKAYWSSRVLAPVNGLWQMVESYHNYIKASPVMTAVPAKP
jgi:Domain of unknown function (DUF4440)